MKRSAGKSPAPPEDHTYFVERPLGKKVGLTLRESGLRVVLHLDRFADDAPDEEWIAQAAAAGWVTLTADVEIRRRPNEKRAIYLAKLRVFALTRNTWTWREKADAFLTALPRMTGILAKTPGPFIARISKAGEVTSVYDFGDYHD